MKQPQQGEENRVRIIDNGGNTNNSSRKIVVPAIGSTIIGRVLRISRMFASIEIVIVDDQPVPYPFTGTIRKLDVRQNAVDDIKIESCYRPGDVVKAEVISLGDRRNYLLSTAKLELGVLNATSANGNDLTPISYAEMEDIVTGGKETRKVAFVE
jgi:exosome complex component CSL4